jgi:hypothetical protein
MDELSAEEQALEELEGSFKVIDVDCNKRKDENDYVEELKRNSRLKLLQEQKIKKAYQDGKELGLFQLFFTDEYLQVVLRWTNHKLKSNNEVAISFNKMKAYLGLEMGMSIVQYNTIDKYWETDFLQGHHNFSDTMSRIDFTTIRSHFTPHENYDANRAEIDPLHGCRSFMTQFRTKSAELAGPDGQIAFDEASARFKGRCRAVSYIPSKPDKFAIRFYASVCWKTLYVHSIVDNNRGLYRICCNPYAYHSLL